MTKQEKYQEQKATCLKRFRGNNKPGKTLVLFLHHGRFCEPLTRPIKNRIDFIIANKAEGEIETRLKWMQPVIPNALSSKCRKALTRCAKTLAEYDKARAEYDKVRAKYVGARAEYDKALAEFTKLYEPEFMAEHPDCPWNGETLFPRNKIQ